MSARALRLDLGAASACGSERQGGCCPREPSVATLNLSSKISEEAFYLMLYLSDARAASKLKIQIML